MDLLLRRHSVRLWFRHPQRRPLLSAGPNHLALAAWYNDYDSSFSAAGGSGAGGHCRSLVVSAGSGAGSLFVSSNWSAPSWRLRTSVGAFSTTIDSSTSTTDSDTPTTTTTTTTTTNNANTNDNTTTTTTISHQLLQEQQQFFDDRFQDLVRASHEQLRLTSSSSSSSNAVTVTTTSLCDLLRQWEDFLLSLYSFSSGCSLPPNEQEQLQLELLQKHQQQQQDEALTCMMDLFRQWMILQEEDKARDYRPTNSTTEEGKEEEPFRILLRVLSHSQEHYHSKHNDSLSSSPSSLLLSSYHDQKENDDSSFHASHSLHDGTDSGTATTNTTTTFTTPFWAGPAAWDVWTRWMERYGGDLERAPRRSDYDSVWQALAHDATTINQWWPLVSNNMHRTTSYRTDDDDNDDDAYNNDDYDEATARAITIVANNNALVAIQLLQRLEDCQSTTLAPPNWQTYQWVVRCITTALQCPLSSPSSPDQDKQEDDQVHWMNHCMNRILKEVVTTTTTTTTSATTMPLGMKLQPHVTTAQVVLTLQALCGVLLVLPLENDDNNNTHSWRRKKNQDWTHAFVTLLGSLSSPQNKQDDTMHRLVALAPQLSDTAEVIMGQLIYDANHHKNDHSLSSKTVATTTTTTTTNVIGTGSDNTALATARYVDMIMQGLEQLHVPPHLHVPTSGLYKLAVTAWARAESKQGSFRSRSKSRCHYWLQRMEKDHFRRFGDYNPQHQQQRKQSHRQPLGDGDHSTPRRNVALNRDGVTMAWNHLMKAYLEAQDYFRVQATWRDMSRREIRPNTTSYAIILKALANADGPMVPKAEEAVALLQCMRGTHWNRPDRRHYGYVLMAWSRVESQYGRAAQICQNVFEWMLQDAEAAEPSERRKVEPNRFHFVSVISALGKQARVDPSTVSKLRSFYANLKERGFVIDIKTHNAILKALSKTRTIEGALWAQQLLDDMIEEEQKQNPYIRPTQSSFASVMFAWAGCGHLEKCEDTLKRLEQAYVESGRNASLRPSSAAYLALLNARTQGDRKIAGEHADRVLDEMEFAAARDLADLPDRRLFNSVIVSHAISGDPDSFSSAERVLDRMVKSYESGNVTAKPDAETMTALLRVISLSSFMPNKASMSWKVLHDMCQKYQEGDLEMRPAPRTFHAVLKACLYTPEGDQKQREEAVKVAIKVMNEMEQGPYGDRPNEHIYRVLFMIFARHVVDVESRSHMASHFLERCCQEGCLSPDVVNTLQSAMPRLYENLPKDEGKKGVKLLPHWTRNVKKPMEK